MNDFSKLEPTSHMLQWLAEDPFTAIFTEVEGVLQQQVPGSQLMALRVTSDPQWLTGGRRLEEDPEKVILVRTAVAFEFDLLVREPTGPQHQLKGVFSWVGTSLDDVENRKSRIWFDLDATLTTHGSEGELLNKLYGE
jgi:hypothetical protein